MDLSYFNARVRGLRGRLFRADEYEPMAALGGTQEFVDRLRHTTYGPRIEVARTRTGSDTEALSSALLASLTDAFTLVSRSVPESASALLTAFFTTWEAYNIKAIVRGVANGVKREEIIALLVPAGEFDRSALNVLAHAKDIPDIVRFLRTWSSAYAPPLAAALGDYAKTGSTSGMELNVDLFAAARALELAVGRGEAAKLVREVLSLRIDSLNVMTLFKICGEGYTREGALSLHVDGGTISLKQFAALTEPGERVELLYKLTETLPAGPLREELSMADHEDMAMLEERLDEVVAAMLRKRALPDPLGIALSLSYLCMKVREVKNLRIIGRGISFGIPPGEIKSMLFYPL